MKSKYGQECPKHPELAGRRYIPSNACIKCHSERMRGYHALKKSQMNELIAAAIEVRGNHGRIDKALKELGYDA